MRIRARGRGRRRGPVLQPVELDRSLDRFVTHETGLARFVAVAAIRPLGRRKTPARTGAPPVRGDAGGGTRTPDTRIMIPPGLPVFIGDSADFGRQIGLFCQATCTNGERALAVNRWAARRCRRPGLRQDGRSGHPGEAPRARLDPPPRRQSERRSRKPVIAVAAGPARKRGHRGVGRSSVVTQRPQRREPASRRRIPRQRAE